MSIDARRTEKCFHYYRENSSYLDQMLPKMDSETENYFNDQLGGM